MINGTCWVTGWKKISGRDQSQETEIYFTPNFFSEEKAHARMFLINCTNISLDGNFTCKKSAGYEIKILNFPLFISRDKQCCCLELRCKQKLTKT